jgi:hypothetical protein
MKKANTSTDPVQVSQINLKTTAEKNLEVNIAEIKNFTGIPDYILACHADWPVVCKTPEGYFCIDGWKMIEEAQKAGNDKITVKIYVIAEHSEDELKLRKIETRHRTEGGRALYVETLRNIKIVASTISGDLNLIRFCHGGRRRGLKYNETTDALSFVDVLVARTGAQKSTVQKHLWYTTFLTLETLDFLVKEAVEADSVDDAKKPGSKFFNLIAKERTNQIKALKDARASEDEITKKISEQIIEWWQEYKHSGTVKAISTSRSTDPEEETDDEPLREELSSEKKSADRPHTEKPLTFNEIRASYRRPLQVISEFIETETPDDSREREFENAMEEIMMLYSQWKAHRTQRMAEAA